MPLIELPFGLPGRIFRSPMPFGPYDLHGEVYDRFCEEQITVIVLLASDEECLRRQDVICERCTSKRDSRCSIYRSPTLACQLKTTWNRQSNTRLPTHKQDSTSPFIVLQVLGVLGSLWRIWGSGIWGSLGLRLSNGCDAISPMLRKRLRNNSGYSMMMRHTGAHNGRQSHHVIPYGAVLSLARR